MKKLIYISVFLLSLTSCDDELEQANPNVLTEESFWETEGDALSALAATYKYLKQNTFGYWGYRVVQLQNARADDFFLRNDNRGLYQLSTFSNSPTTDTPGFLFSGAYTGIFRANQVITNTPNSNIQEGIQNQLVAEAKFLRALNYYHLVLNFEAVPIFTTVPQVREDYFKAKSTREEIWIQIENDFQEAKSVLPTSYPPEWVGRATRGAAIGYLGKSYVYQEKWEEAINEFELLVEPTGEAKAPYNYKLLEDYEHNFMAEFDNNEESLFEIQIQNVGGSDAWGGENANESQGVVIAYGMAPTEVGGWFQMHPTNKMFNEFQKERTVDGDFDPRMYASIVWDYPGAMFYNRPFTEFEQVFNKNAKVRKYQNWRNDNEGIPGSSEINEKALRFADILLLYAEALTMQGRVAEALPLVNRIRNRADLTDLLSVLDKNAMMDEIQHQRMVEFFREGQRFYDLRRWGLLDEEISASDKEGREFFDEDRHDFFPIPQDEMNTNPEIEQDPNW
jgi:tetratricopeptide (TPR) repeat protein